MKNVALFGEMGAGKTSVAKILEDVYGYQKISLGTKIHSECKLHGSETREEMQQYGQSMRKIFGEDTWCKYLEKRLNTEFKDKYKNHLIVIDDARQVNEFYYFKELGFLPIAVVANEAIRLERLRKRVNYQVNQETKNHETEKQARICIQKCDIVIENNFDNYENLKTAVLQILQNRL